MNFKIIVSISEASLSNSEKLKKIDSYGDCIYRINGAHIDVEGSSAMIKNLRTVLPEAEIMLDLPGNKIRTKGLTDPIRLIKGEVFELYDYQVNYPQFHTHLKANDLILANDSTLTLEVEEIRDKAIKILSHSDGLLHNNKGLHVRGIHKDIPFLFSKDKELIKVACAENIDYISLSFVRTAEDIKGAKRLLSRNQNSNAEIFAKIETAQAVENLGHILKEVKYINLDRGDLSADIGMLRLPAVQERVINSAKRAGRDIYLATQFLKNMETQPVPLIAEVLDLYKTIKVGVSGIQLSEETAIGKYPVECVKLVFNIFHQFFSG